MTQVRSGPKIWSLQPGRADSAHSGRSVGFAGPRKPPAHQRVPLRSPASSLERILDRTDAAVLVMGDTYRSYHRVLPSDRHVAMKERVNGAGNTLGYLGPAPLESGKCLVGIPEQ